MDSTDYKIIELLQLDGRMSMKNLGEKVNLTSPAVSERVKRLEEQGIIVGYMAVVNPKKLNLYVEGLINVGMKVTAHAKFKQLAQRERGIVECHHVTGEDCMTVKVICHDTEELEELLDKIQAIGTTKTSIILSSPLKYKPILPKKIVD